MLTNGKSWENKKKNIFLVIFRLYFNCPVIFGQFQFHSTFHIFILGSIHKYSLFKS